MKLTSHLKSHINTRGPSLHQNLFFTSEGPIMSEICLYIKVSCILERPCNITKSPHHRIKCPPSHWSLSLITTEPHKDHRVISPIFLSRATRVLSLWHLGEMQMVTKGATAPWLRNRALLDAPMLTVNMLPEGEREKSGYQARVCPLPRFTTVAMKVEDRSCNLEGCLDHKTGCTLLGIFWQIKQVTI